MRVLITGAAGFLGSHLTEFKLGGDVRLRHQVETQAPQNGTVSNERTRERFRFRFNGDALMQKGWGAGFALETASAADSGNQTLENGNNDYNLYLARAYVSWRPNLNWMFAGGKQKNPFYTTDMVWDSDINPQGVTEIHTRFIGAKDTLEFRAGQLLMDDNNETGIGRAGRDAWLFAQQAVYTHWFGKDAIGNVVNSLVIAPGFIATDMTGVLDEKVKAAVLEKIPLGDFGQADDIAAAVLFLASPEARYITGQVLAVDGGMVM